MSERTVMEKADDIMASMGLADAVPLSEVTSESLNSVGKNYNEELPELSDDQRNALLEHSLGEGKVKDLSIQAEEGDPKAKKVIKSLEGEPPKRKGTPKVIRQTRARVKAGKQLKRKTAKVVANDPGADLHAAIEAGEKLQKDHKEPTLLGKALSEMTSIGMIGTNSGGANTWKPGKKKKKKGKKASSKFINFELGKL